MGLLFYVRAEVGGLLRWRLQRIWLPLKKVELNWKNLKIVLDKLAYI